VDAVARGRVWTGAQALGLGLVDRLGGLADAHRLAVELAGLPADGPAEALPALVDYPRKQSFAEKLAAALADDKSEGLSAGGGAHAAAGGGWAAAAAEWAAARSGLGEAARAWELAVRAGEMARRAEAEAAGGVRMRMEDADAERWL
jgi:ClpP class serine protease